MDKKLHEDLNRIRKLSGLNEQTVSHTEQLPGGVERQWSYKDTQRGGPTPAYGGTGESDYWGNSSGPTTSGNGPGSGLYGDNLGGGALGGGRGGSQGNSYGQGFNSGGQGTQSGKGNSYSGVTGDGQHYSVVPGAGPGGISRVYRTDPGSTAFSGPSGLGGNPNLDFDGRGSGSTQYVTPGLPSGYDDGDIDSDYIPQERPLSKRQRIELQKQQKIQDQLDRQAQREYEAQAAADAKAARDAARNPTKQMPTTPQTQNTIQAPPTPAPTLTAPSTVKQMPTVTATQPPSSPAPTSIAKDLILKTPDAPVKTMPVVIAPPTPAAPTALTPAPTVKELPKVITPTHPGAQIDIKTPTSEIPNLKAAEKPMMFPNATAQTQTTNKSNFPDFKLPSEKPIQFPDVTAQKPSDTDNKQTAKATVTAPKDEPTDLDTSDPWMPSDKDKPTRPTTPDDKIPQPDDIILRTPKPIAPADDDNPTKIRIPSSLNNEPAAASPPPPAAAAAPPPTYGTPTPPANAPQPQGSGSIAKDLILPKTNEIPPFKMDTPTFQKPSQPISVELVDEPPASAAPPPPPAPAAKGNNGGGKIGSGSPSSSSQGGSAAGDTGASGEKGSPDKKAGGYIPITPKTLGAPIAGQPSIAVQQRAAQGNPFSTDPKIEPPKDLKGVSGSMASPSDNNNVSNGNKATINMSPADAAKAKTNVFKPDTADVEVVPPASTLTIKKPPSADAAERAAEMQKVSDETEKTSKPNESMERMLQLAGIRESAKVERQFLQESTVVKTTSITDTIKRLAGLK